MMCSAGQRTSLSSKGTIRKNHIVGSFKISFMSTHQFAQATSGCVVFIVGGYSTAVAKSQLPKNPSPPGSDIDKSGRVSSLSGQSSAQSRAEEMILFRKSQAGLTALPSERKDTGGATSTSISLGFKGDRAKTPGKGLKGNNMSMSDSRKRIADAVGRR